MFDNTINRIYGEPKPEIMNTWNKEYGTAKNAADYIPRIGRKTHNLERDIQRAVADELLQKEREEEEKRQQRYFDTTNGDTFVE